MTDRDGCELSDRWLEAQTMKDMVCDSWQRIEAEKVPARSAVASIGQPSPRPGRAALR